MTQRRMPSGQGPARDPARGSARRWLSRAAHPVAHRGSARPADAHLAIQRAHRSIDPPERARRTMAPRPPRRISGRAAALGLLVIALVLAYAYPVRVYLAQQAEIDQMLAAQQAQRQRIQALTEELDRWDDDQYVIAQARKRLHYVRRGERVYVVGADPAAAAGSGANPAPATWLSQLWANIQAADDPPTS
jgi:cell division protein FtsB